MEPLHVLALHVGSECSPTPPRSYGLRILSPGWKLLVDLLVWSFARSVTQMKAIRGRGNLGLPQGPLADPGDAC